MTSEQMGLTSISINLVQVKKMSLLVFARVLEQSSLIPTLLQCNTSTSYSFSYFTTIYEA